MERYSLVWTLIFATVLVANLSLSNPAWAQGIDLQVENPAEAEVTGQTAVAVGLGAGIAPEYEGSSDYRAIPIPFSSARFSNDMSLLWIANVARANLTSQPDLDGRPHAPVYPGKRRCGQR